MESNNTLYRYTTRYTIEYLIKVFSSTLGITTSISNPIKALNSVIGYINTKANDDIVNITKAIMCGLLGIDATERIFNSKSSNPISIELNLSINNTEIQLLNNYLLILCSDCLKELMTNKTGNDSNKNIEEQLSIRLREVIVSESEKEKDKHIYSYMYYLNSLLYFLNANFFFIIAFLNENNDSYFIDLIQSFLNLTSSNSSQCFLKNLSIPKTLNELKTFGFNVLALINYDKIESKEDGGKEEIEQVINSTSLSQSIKKELIVMKLNEIRTMLLIEDNAEDVIEEDIKDDIRPELIDSKDEGVIESTNEGTDNRFIREQEPISHDIINNIYFDFYDKLHEELRKQREEYEQLLHTTVEDIHSKHKMEIDKLKEEFDTKLKKELYYINKRLDNTLNNQ